MFPSNLWTAKKQNKTKGESHCDGRTVQRGKHQILADSFV